MMATVTTLGVLLGAANLIRMAWAWALRPDVRVVPELVRVVEVRLVAVRTNPGR